MKTSEYIEFVVNPSAINLIGNLKPGKGIENNRFELQLGPISKNTQTGKVEDEDNDDLQDGLAQHHFPHIAAYYGSSRGRLSLEKRQRWRICGERQCSEGILNKIDPQQWYYGQHGLSIGTR